MKQLSVRWIAGLILGVLIFTVAAMAKAGGNHKGKISSQIDSIIETPTNGGIVENIPAKYQERYQKWKTDMLSTAFGRLEWEKYDRRKNFILEITISNKESEGAGTSDYKWNERGELVGATIFLGEKLNKGVPSPKYYPVMNSISDFNQSDEIGDETLAATKFVHEFGHVDMPLEMNPGIFQLQNQLIPEYNKILLSNGYNIQDPRLLELAKKMGGTPVEIWQAREIWGESSAMRFLLERIQKTDYYCAVVKKINYNVVSFAQTYKEKLFNEENLQSVTECIN